MGGEIKNSIRLVNPIERNEIVTFNTIFTCSPNFHTLTKSDLISVTTQGVNTGKVKIKVKTIKVKFEVKNILVKVEVKTRKVKMGVKK